VYVIHRGLRLTPYGCYSNPLWKSFVSLLPLLLTSVAWPTPLQAAICSSPFSLFWEPLPGEDARPNNCLGASGFRCYEAESLGTFARLVDADCDPTQEPCSVQLGLSLEFPGLEAMIAEDGQVHTPLIEWEFSGGGFVGTCGLDGVDGRIVSDFVESFLQFGGVTCANSQNVVNVFTVEARVCMAACPRTTTVTVLDGGPAFTRGIGCPLPPLPATCGESSCTICVKGVPVGGGGAETDGGGPGARLRYAAGGAGRSDSPGATAWRTTLGRYWSHDYAERIVEDPDDSHVWLITKLGSFRGFSGKDAGGVYQTVSPSDEYRTLTRTAGGWELRDLEGTVQAFGSDGRWLSTTDRNGNAKTAGYDAFGVLTEVTFPDGRSETFTYDVGGKLASISEVGVGGADSLTWNYTWTGDDLTRIDRPDGTSLEFLYEDPRNPGYMTQQILVGTSGGRRVERAWQMDALGNVIAVWEGSVVAGPNGPEPPADAVDLYRFAYDDPAFPTETTVTDPLGMPAIYQLDRDPASRKVRVTSISGSCPTCTSGPNATFEYGDPANTLRVTKEIDGRGHETVMEYDANGQITHRLKAVDTPALTRETTWEYDPTYPALPTRIERPSVTGGPELRVTTFVYDASGNLLDRIDEGVEDGAAFTFTRRAPTRPRVR
jgi:YD repeat-containing protein